MSTLTQCSSASPRSWTRRTAAPADNLATNDAVHIDRVHGRYELVLSGLDKLDEPPSLLALRTLVAQRLPRVELPELLLEVQAWTGFASDFTHVNEHGARADDLPSAAWMPMRAVTRPRATCALMFWGESRKAVSSGSWREGALPGAGSICMGFPCLLSTTETPGRSSQKRFGFCQKFERIGCSSSTRVFN